jgi:hypothetical protein
MDISHERTSTEGSLKKKKFGSNTKVVVEGHTSSLAVKLAAALRLKMKLMAGIDLNKPRARHSSLKTKSKPIEIEGHTSNLAIKLAGALRKKMGLSANQSPKERLKRATERLRSKESAFSVHSAAHVRSKTIFDEYKTDDQVSGSKKVTQTEVAEAIKPLPMHVRLNRRDKLVLKNPQNSH